MLGDVSILVGVAALRGAHGSVGVQLASPAPIAAAIGPARRRAFVGAGVGGIRLAVEAAGIQHVGRNRHAFPQRSGESTVEALPGADLVAAHAVDAEATPALDATLAALPVALLSAAAVHAAVA